MSRRGVFLDLNGTLVEPLKQERLDELTLLPGVAEAVARLTAAGFVCPVVTVQSRIAKGLFSMAEFHAWFAAFAADLQAHGAIVAGPYVCPHRYSEPCPCRKPNVLLYERAASEHQLTAADCFVIGDSPDDMGAARRLGGRGCLVRTGWARDPRVVAAALPDASIVTGSFAQAVDWILGSGQRTTQERIAPVRTAAPPDQPLITAPEPVGSHLIEGQAESPNLPRSRRSSRRL